MTTRIIFKTGNIVEEQTDGLVCSGNVQLNMSGGVNGELLHRGGKKMQEQLHSYLKEQKKHYVDSGFVMRIGPEPTHFRCIVYSVAIDAWYSSSVDLVCQTLTNALTILQQEGCRSVAIPALATGYGNLKKEDFGRALQRCLNMQEWPFDEIRIVLKNESDLAQVRQGYDNP